MSLTLSHIARWTNSVKGEQYNNVEFLRLRKKDFWGTMNPTYFPGPRPPPGSSSPTAAARLGFSPEPRAVSKDFPDTSQPLRRESRQGSVPNMMEEVAKARTLELEDRVRKLEMENSVLRAGQEEKSGAKADDAASLFLQERCKDLENQVLNFQEKIKLSEHQKAEDDKKITDVEKNLEKVQKERRKYIDEVEELKPKVLSGQQEVGEWKSKAAQFEAKMKGGVVENGMSAKKHSDSENDSSPTLLKISFGGVVLAPHTFENGCSSLAARSANPHF